MTEYGKINMWSVYGAPSKQPSTAASTKGSVDDALFVVQDDILKRLRNHEKHWSQGHDGKTDCERGLCSQCQAADEIERLRRALDLSIGELSTNDKYQYLSPEQLRNHFLEEARRD